LRNCKLSGAAGGAIGAALLTNKTLTDLKYGARSFAYLFFCTASVQNKNVLTYYISPSLLHCSLRGCQLSGAAGEAIGKALLTNKTLTDLKYGARSFAYLFFCTASVQNKNVLTFYIVPPFCSLEGCGLSGAAGEAIGAALLTNKTLTDLKHGALLSVFERLFL
jgi:hypothetical protein